MLMEGHLPVKSQAFCPDFHLCAIILYFALIHA